MNPILFERLDEVVNVRAQRLREFIVAAANGDMQVTAALDNADVGRMVLGLGDAKCDLADRGLYGFCF